MPKIIENLESRLMAEARQQIETNGYAATTIRSVAGGCGVGVGTVYNYFPSKDDLAAAYLLEDWRARIAAAEDLSHQAEDPRDVVWCLYDHMRCFSRQHRAVFSDAEAVASFTGSFSRYHGILRSQLAVPLMRFCQDAFCAEFIAEALLTWTMSGKDFDEIYSILVKLF